jgi:hypothetical protein
MPDNLARAHPARVHRDDLVIEAGKPALVLGDELRIEARLPVPRHLQLEPAAVRRHRFAAIAVAAVARPSLSDEMMVHLGIQRPVGQRLLQLVEKAIRIKRRLRIGAGQKLVEDGIRNLRFFASRHIGAPLIPLCPAPHGIPDSPSATSC